MPVIEVRDGARNVPMSFFPNEDYAFTYARENHACVYDDATMACVYCFRSRPLNPSPNSPPLSPGEGTRWRAFASSRKRADITRRMG